MYVGPGTTDRRLLHADERGSIVAVTDASANLLAAVGIVVGGTIYVADRLTGGIVAKLTRKGYGSMSVKIVVEIFLILMSVWSAHLAGAMYYQSGQDRSLRLPAVARSVVSIAAGAVALAI